jgi:hypothetical protein
MKYSYERDIVNEASACKQSYLIIHGYDEDIQSQ